MGATCTITGADLYAFNPHARSFAMSLSASLLGSPFHHLNSFKHFNTHSHTRVRSSLLHTCHYKQAGMSCLHVPDPGHPLPTSPALITHINAYLAVVAEAVSLVVCVGSMASEATFCQLHHQIVQCSRPESLPPPLLPLIPLPQCLSTHAHTHLHIMDGVLGLHKLCMLFVACDSVLGFEDAVCDPP